MKIALEQLPHQQEALEAIHQAFRGLDEFSDEPDKDYVYANPLINYRGQDESNIDIKMETGTGKTYVGVRAIYDLHQKYGLFKFIIVVPGPAIKMGWKNFIESDYARQHFSEFYENTRINLSVINNGDFNSKKGLLPAHLVEFVEGSRLNSSTIEVMLINAGMLTSDNMKGIITRGKDAGKERFNQALLSGFTKPDEAISATRPIVIIDEPHRFNRGNSQYESILDLHPQMIIRLGATFPIKQEGSGRNKVEITDYYRKKPQHNLNAVDAFNEGLVKGIDIYYPTVPEDQARDRYKVHKVKSKTLALKKGTETFEFGVGDTLPFEGDIHYEGGGLLSSGLEVSEGMELLSATMQNSYQELIIRNAIDKHFEAEIANFMRDSQYQARIKTLSLFFIDSIKSYREHDGWLKKTFEKHLQAKVVSLIKNYKLKQRPREREYVSYLEATLKNLKDNVHAGYFSEDNGSGDEAIQAEVEDILRNKEKLLSFKDTHGNWETRRFLFSKWTLREGWDNPNVFVIAKLRSSGSENSKIQEVGRGLRLPVDENGHRVLQTEWDSRLRYLISYDEQGFAKKLVAEVNKDAKLLIEGTHLSQAIIDEILKYDSSLTEETLLEKLDNENVINRTNVFKENGIKKLLELYPFLGEKNRVRKDIITENKAKNTQRIKLNKENWRKMQSLWQKFSNRYMLEFDDAGSEAIQLIVESALSQRDNYMKQRAGIIHNQLAIDDKGSNMLIKDQQSELSGAEPLLGMRYGDFVVRLARETRIQPSLLHKSLYPMLNDTLNGETDYLNSLTLDNLVKDIRRRFDSRFAQSYHYHPLDFQASTSIYDAEANDFKDDILASLIGVKEDHHVIADSRQLYEVPPLRYDSEKPEKELLKYGYDQKVIAFGKLPKRAIQVPKYTGGSTTPDFIFMVEKEDDTHVYLLVETKAEGAGMRLSDEQIIKIQEKFFGQLEEFGVEYQVATSAQEVYNKLLKVVNPE